MRLQMFGSDEFKATGSWADTHCIHIHAHITAAHFFDYCNNNE